MPKTNSPVAIISLATLIVSIRSQPRPHYPVRGGGGEGIIWAYSGDNRRRAALAL